MDGYTFNGDYIGYSTLSKPATGVGILQQPIKEQYLKARKQGNSKKVMLRLVQAGLAISLVDTGGGQKGEMFYEISSISYIESLRFTVLSGNSDKKVRAMFVPLGESSLPSVKDKNAFTIDKNFHFLTQISHPALLACVLRRPKGVKALDCHIFMLENVEDAFKIVSIVRHIQTRGSNPDVMTELKQNDNSSFKRGQNNDVIRTEYGEYSVYRGQKQYELKDDFFRPPGQEGGPQGEYRPPGPEGGPDFNNEDPGYGWSYERSRENNDEHWRTFDHDRFGGQDERFPGQLRAGSQNRGEYSYDQGGREYISHGRQRSSDSGEGRMNMSFSDSSERGGRHDDHTERRSWNERERGNISPRAAHLPPPRVAEKPQKPDPMMRSMGPPSPNQHSPPRPLSPRGMDSPRSANYQHPPASAYNQPAQGGRYGPSSPGGPVYSMSNLESRQTDVRVPEEEAAPKPVAKVPPHMVAGVKVLPTGFAPSAIKLKPKTTKHDRSYGSEDSDPDYDNNIHMYKKPTNDYQNYHSEKYTEERNIYNHNHSNEGRGKGGDNYGKGGDNYGKGGDNYGKAGDNYGKGGDNYGRSGGYGDYNKGGTYGDSSYTKEGSQNRGFSYAPEYGRQISDEKTESRQYIESYDGPYGVQRRDTDHRQADKGGSNRYSAPSTAYDDRSHDPGNRWSGSSGGGQGRSQSNYDLGSRAPSGGDGGQGPKGKEAEIASMFTNFQLQKGEPTPYTTSGTDFEQSLGYFP
ncbi:filaggrin-2-like [Haliotis rubra]|uniref:filaggrin-2-like n=1 Tax=Haliotis rubra TaxID=36100 RepID=UPI001EE4FCBA|nr:filaggrin-2-like [Haliotis rubra]XP_046581844.1 filaggrin-2-like [Haliotis rubra]XP_046581845.1 filaggrin-2-like [Haliotis rubra]XP_046581846.1 filaggrin-2-like [Haliotis rubra]XP_046581847.1 filaggrin-2-like [Haliotis rubra]XP_046581848.1 filaggrin-2-like [Haliotis rubra]